MHTAKTADHLPSKGGIFDDKSFVYSEKSLMKLSAKLFGRAKFIYDEWRNLV